jgi:hypothetical protein
MAMATVAQVNAHRIDPLIITLFILLGIGGAVVQNPAAFLYVDARLRQTKTPAFDIPALGNVPRQNLFRVDYLRGNEKNRFDEIVGRTVGPEQLADPWQILEKRHAL